MQLPVINLYYKYHSVKGAFLPKILTWPGWVVKEGWTSVKKTQCSVFGVQHRFIKHGGVIKGFSLIDEYHKISHCKVKD